MTGVQTCALPICPNPVADAAPPPALPVSPPPTPDPSAKAAPLLAVADGDKYRWQFDKYGYPLPLQIKVVEPLAVSEGRTEVSIETTTLLSDFEDAANLLAKSHGTAFDIERWERMRLIPTPPTWSYLTEAADALRNPASLPVTKVEEYNSALMEYRTHLQLALNGIWYAVAIAARMTTHARKSSSVDQERQSLEILAEVLAETSSRDLMLKQLLAIAADVVTGIPSPANGVGVNPNYRTMLEAIEKAAKTVRELPTMTVSEVNQQIGRFYEHWFVQFYEGRRPQVDSLWPFLSQAMDSLPLGLEKINPLRMTIADWTGVNLKPRDPRQRAVSLERLGFRRSAEELTVNTPGTPGDSLLTAMLQSIRKRGYEKASVILQPLPQTITQTWLPSENIACRIGKNLTELPSGDVKYLLVEVNEGAQPDQIRPDFEGLSPTPRVALFGSAASLPNMPRAYPYPYVPSPQSLDDLVERLDARRASDWADPKSRPP